MDAIHCGLALNNVDFSLVSRCDLLYSRAVLYSATCKAQYHLALVYVEVFSFVYSVCPLRADDLVPRQDGRA